jgi:hypothetical protein
LGPETQSCVVCFHSCSCLLYHNQEELKQKVRLQLKKSKSLENDPQSLAKTCFNKTSSCFVKRNDWTSFIKADPGTKTFLPLNNRHLSLPYLPHPLLVKPYLNFTYNFNLKSHWFLAEHFKPKNNMMLFMLQQ